MKPALLITGAAGVIGRAIVFRLAQDKEWSQARWLLTGREPARLAPLMARLGQKGLQAQALGLDMADEAGCEAFLDALPGLGPFKGLALLAGINHDDPLPTLKDAVWDRVWQVNTGFHTRLLRRLAQAGQFAGDARAILTGSQVGLRGNAGQTAYAAAKGALVDLMLAGPSGLRLNVLLPPLVPSPLLDGLSPQALESLFAARLMQDPDPASSCAEGAAFLMGDASRYVHRQVWHPDTRVSVLGWP